jgi:putative transposase
MAGCVRLVWNKALALQKSNCEYINQQFNLLGGKAMGAAEAKQLKKVLYTQFWVNGNAISVKALVAVWKKSEELHFLNDCPSQALQKPLADLDKSFFKCFTKAGGFPRFKKKGNHDSIHFPQGFKIDGSKLYIPKLGWVKFFKSSNIVGEIKSVTVSSDGLGNWFAAIAVEQDNIVLDRVGSEIGIDVGISKFAACSDGTFEYSPKPYTSLRKRLKILQRAVARKKKTSNNRKKAQKKVTKLHARIANIRKDFLHKTSTKLSKNHAMIVVEDLKISNMSSSASGTMEKPGVNVSAKSGLNRSILDQGWGEFRRQLKYKQEWSGGIFVAVNPKHTSQTCNECGYVDKSNRLTQSHFVCLSCGHKSNADTNAAKNILRAGHVRLACGDIELSSSSPGILL